MILLLIAFLYSQLKFPIQKVLTLVNEVLPAKHSKNVVKIYEQRIGLLHSRPIQLYTCRLEAIPEWQENNCKI